MLTLSPAAIQEKNKIASTGAWLILLQVDFPAPHLPIYLCYNTEDVTWDGNLYQGFPFEIGEVKEDSKGGLPTFEIKASNVTRVLEPYVESTNGGAGATITMRVVHSDNLTNLTPELEETFDNLGCSVSQQWITFKLGAENPMRQRSPKDRYLKDHCRWKEFKGAECAYAGVESECNRTFTRCIELSNEARFGGFPSVGGGVYV